nr:glycine betaine ABC transporter substrate-binding protein [Desulfoscipio gibsoniae]
MKVQERVAALKEAIDNHKWIVVTGWTPHWMFARWDLKYLDDPKYIIQGKETQYIATMVKKGLKDEAPAAYQMLDNFHWEPKNMKSVMLDINQNGMKPKDAAKKFVENNKELVNSWLSEGYKI